MKKLFFATIIVAVTFAVHSNVFYFGVAYNF